MQKEAEKYNAKPQFLRPKKLASIPPPLGKRYYTQLIGMKKNIIKKLML